MENFNESILCQNGIGILDYLSDGRHQEELMKEVSRLGDSELSGLYEKLFQGDAKEVSGKKILRKLFNENEQIKLIKESILQNELPNVYMPSIQNRNSQKMLTVMILPTHTGILCISQPLA